MSDPIGGDVKAQSDYGDWNQVTSTTGPHRASEPGYQTSYVYGAGNRLTSVSLPGEGTVSYSYQLNQTTATNVDGHNRRYTYQEDGKIGQVLEEDDSGQLTVTTSYSYDTLGRLVTISQGAQTRSFVYP